MASVQGALSFSRELYHGPPLGLLSLGEAELGPALQRSLCGREVKCSASSHMTEFGRDPSVPVESSETAALANSLAATSRETRN